MNVRALHQTIDRRIDLRVPTGVTEPLVGTIDSVVPGTSDVMVRIGASAVPVPARVPELARRLRAGARVSLDHRAGWLLVDKVLARGTDDRPPWVALAELGAVGDGAADDTAVLQEAFALGITVIASVGATYLVSRSLYAAAGTVLFLHGATIRLRDGATAYTGGLIDATAGDLRIMGGTIDGNAEKNVMPAQHPSLLYIGAGDDVQAHDVTFRGAIGYGARITTGLRPRFIDCTFDGITFSAIDVLTGTFNHPTRMVVRDCVMGDIGSHGVITVGADGCHIETTTIEGTLVAGIVVDVATPVGNDSTVTWVSGPTFAGLKVGNYLFTSGGQELFITEMVSDTELIGSRSSTPPVPGTGLAAAGGTGDLINVSDAREIWIDDNDCISGVSLGIVIWNHSASTQRGRIKGNVCRSQGAAGISLQTAGVHETRGVAIIGNTVYRPGMGEDAEDDIVRVGISLIGANIKDTLVDANTVYDDQGTPTMKSWMRLSGVSAGEVAVGRNHTWGAEDDGIDGGIASITLSAGWGSTAAVSAIVCHGSSYTYRVTAGGSGIAANPTMTVSHRATGPENPPAPVCVNEASSSTPARVDRVIASQTMAQSVFTWVGTPVSGATYDFNVKA
jgi:hypothetical protein